MSTTHSLRMFELQLSTVPNSAFSGGSRLHTSRQVAICFCHFPRGSDGARQVWADQAHTVCLAVWFVALQVGMMSAPTTLWSLPRDTEGWLLSRRAWDPPMYIKSPDSDTQALPKSESGFYWNSHHSSLPWIPRAFALTLNEDMDPSWRRGIIGDATLIMER